MNPIETAHRTGQVTRYHAKPEMAKLCQSIADHTGGMLLLLYQLNPTPSALLVKAMVHHDNPELFGGDLSYNFKRANPEFAKKHDELSIELAKDAGQVVTQISLHDQKWIDMIDRLEPYLYAKIHRPEIIQNEHWVATKHWIIDQAKELGCWDGKLDGVLEDTRPQETTDQKKAEEKRADEVQLRIDLLDMFASDEKLVYLLANSITGGASIGPTVVRSHLAHMRKELDGSADTARRTEKPAYKPGPRQAKAERPVSQLEANLVALSRLGRQAQKAQMPRLTRLTQRPSKSDVAIGDWDFLR